MIRPAPARDTFDKVVASYFSALTKRPFMFRGQTFKPKPLTLSPLLLRGHTCPEKCGACCARGSLDYLPSEAHPPSVDFRTVEFDGQAFALLSDLQRDRTVLKCRHLQYDTGRCDIYDVRPMVCDVELVKFLHYEEQAVLLSKLYGRYPVMLRVDGWKGTRCEMLPGSQETMIEILRKLRRLRDWCLYFGLDSWIDDVITWIETYSMKHAVRFSLGNGPQLFDVSGKVLS